MNNWKNIWAKRSANFDILCNGDVKDIFLELKRNNGFDVIGDGLSYEALLEQYQKTKELLSKENGSEESQVINSVYEIGCGSGANLYLFERDGIRCGGIDYSESLIEIAKKVLKTEDICCGEAIEVPVSNTYDAILSNSVFSYFEDEKYASRVLEKMYQKSNYSIGIIDIHDVEKESAFLKYRKESVPDYEERYKNLPKLFYNKSFFEKFAEEHNMDITFTDSEMDGYWNNEFVFNCYFYKRI